MSPLRIKSAVQNVGRPFRAGMIAGAKAPAYVGLATRSETIEKIERLEMSWRKRLVAIAVACASSAVAVLAQVQEGFRPATDIQKESLPAGPLVYTAYAIVWLVLIGYVFLLWRRLDRVEKELRDVTARIGGGNR